MAVVAVLMFVAFVVPAEAVPLPRPQEITLQVPSELLKEHTLILTLQPLPTKGKSLVLGIEGSSTNTSSSDGTLAEEDAPLDADGERKEKRKQEREKEHVSKGDEEQQQEDESTAPTTILPITTTTTTPEDATETTPKRPLGSKRTTTSSPALILPAGGRTDGLDGILLEFPRVVCPPGSSPDRTGKCRMHFRPSFNIGKSFGHSGTPLIYSQALHIPE